MNATERAMSRVRNGWHIAGCQALLASPFVVRHGDAFEFLHEGRVVYDLTPTDAADALRQIEHLAGKSWLTREHVEQFARLTAERFGAGYR